MFQHLVFVGVIAVAAAASAPAEAATRFRTDPAQSFLSFDEAVWRHGDDGSWHTQWEERRIPLNLDFDLEVMDSPANFWVKRLALSKVSLDLPLPAGNPFSLPRLLSWYPGSSTVEWFDRPTYNDGFTGLDVVCACVFAGDARYESGSFDGARLDVQGGIGLRLSYFTTALTSTADTDIPPPQLLAQTPVSSAFGYRLVAVPVPEPETVGLLLVGLPLLAVVWSRENRGVGSAPPVRRPSGRQMKS